MRRGHGADIGQPGLPLPEGDRVRDDRHRRADRRERQHLRRPDLQLRHWRGHRDRHRPDPLTNATTATFTFHSTASGATFACSLDGAAATPCTSPASYSGLAEGAHTFTVAATANGTADPTPATDTWTVDTTPPSTPAGLTATATGADHGEPVLERVHRQQRRHRL